MKVQNKLEIQDTLKVGVLPNATTSNFSVLFNDGGDVKKRTVGSIINKNEGDYLPSVSNLFPDIFNFNNSTTFSTPNLTVSLKNQLKNTVFAAPTNLNGTPSFRFLENSDLENTTVSYQGHLHQTGDINGLNSVLDSKANVNDQRILNGQIAFDKLSSVQSQLSTVNWYRIAKGTVTGGHGCSFIVIIERNFMNQNNESYTFSINTAHDGKTTITQLSGVSNVNVITAIRVVNTNSDVVYLDIMYISSHLNVINVRVFGSAEAIPATIAPTVTTGVTELETTNGMAVLGNGNSSQWNQAFNRGDFRAFGLGITNSDSTPSEANSFSNSCFFAVSNGTSGFLDNGYYYAGINIQGPESSRKIQLIGRTGDMKYFLRSSSDGGTTWYTAEIFTTANFNPSSYATTNEINNIYDQLGAKANTRLSNVASDLSAVEKTTIKTKLGISESDASNSISKVDIHISQDFQNILNNISNVGLEWGVSYRRGKTLGISIAIYNNSNNSIEILPQGTVGLNLMTLDSQILQRCNSNITELSPFLKLIHNDFLFNINNGSTYLDFGDGRISHTGSLTVDRNSKLIITGELECLNI